MPGAQADVEWGLDALEELGPCYCCARDGDIEQSQRPFYRKSFPEAADVEHTLGCSASPADYTTLELIEDNRSVWNSIVGNSANLSEKDSSDRDSVTDRMNLYGLGRPEGGVQVIREPVQLVMSSVAVNRRPVPAQKWSVMPSDVVYTVTDKTLVVEDNERAAEAENATGKAVKEASNINNGHSLSNHEGRNYFHNNHHSSQNFHNNHHNPLPPHRYNSFGCPVPLTRTSPDRATDVITVSPTKTKLRSFQERDKPYYHDAKFLQSEQFIIPSSQNHGEPSEKDDEGGHPSDDGINPLQNDMKSGPPSLYVRLPKKVPITETDSAAGLLKNQTLASSQESDDPGEPPSKGGPTNNNKEPEGELESSCLVDCLYYTIVCCDCSIM